MVVAVVTAVLILAPATVAALRPAGQSIDAARLREEILNSDTRPYQGYAQSNGALALPDLPNLSGVSALFSGATTTHVWYAAPDRYRVAVVTPTGETDLYRMPEGEYTWDYGANMLTELDGDPTLRLPRASDLVPPQLALWVLRAAPTDPVTTLPARRVGGVAASGLRLVPSDPRTLIGQVDIWADPHTGLPVQVEITPRGQQGPILRSAFESLDQTAPAVDRPVPARGSGFTVAHSSDVIRAFRGLGRAPLPATLAGWPEREAGFGGVPGAALYGSGLATFAVITVPTPVADGIGDAAGKAGAGTVRLTDGTVVLMSVSPVSLAVVRPAFGRRSYVLAGPVTTSVLQSVADSLTQLRPVTR
jgi:hypothetical protein